MGLIRAVSFVVMLACASAFAQADFSAEIANTLTSSNTFQTKIYSTRGKLRFEGEDKSGRPNSIMLVDLVSRTSVVLVPQQKQYVQSKMPQIPGQGVAFFQAKDVESACREYLKLPQVEKGKCKKIGHETVNGRDTVKYEVSPQEGAAGPMWIDVKLHFPVKWQNAASAGELKNIREEAQPGRLFEIPAGYTKRVFTNPENKK